jgi:6-phosphogluconolactonase (cycloisomerase 2 family)
MFSPAGDYFLVPDKGLDTIFTCRLDPETGRLRLAGTTRLREFSGPRHVVFHPRQPLAYSINELNSTLTVLDCAPESSLRPVQILSTVEDADVRDTRAAELAISGDGRFLHASNRSGAGDKTPGGPGDDTIGVYAVKNDGTLSPAAWTSSGGIRPASSRLAAMAGLSSQPTKKAVPPTRLPSIHQTANLGGASRSRGQIRPFASPLASRQHPGPCSSSGKPSRLL